jgi:hypothetical protein
MNDGEKLARQFHTLYEAMAPGFGYETRTETREFDPESNNGRLMIAVCSAISGMHTQQLAEARANLEDYEHVEHCRDCGNHLTGAAEEPRQCRCCQAEQQLAEASALWNAAVEAEGTDWADEIMRVAKEGGGP